MARLPHPARLALGAAVSLVALVTLGPGRTARADVAQDRFSAAGYLRVMTRPDFQGGDGRLGFWNLYGRLLNEGPYAALQLRLDLQPRAPGSKAPWTAVQARVEGGSIMNVDDAGGSLASFRLSQLNVQAGNVLVEDVTFTIGTLDYWIGDLALYDMRPAQLFFETVGVFARIDQPRYEILLGAGDAGRTLHRGRYSTVFTTGGQVRLRVSKHFELGTGAQVFVEPEVRGNRNAPHATPGVDYEDYVRGEVAETFVLANPGMESLFPRPEPTAASSWKLIGYVGFGGLGPIKWNNFFANFLVRHPDQSVTETYQGQEYLIYVKDLTDERYQINLGNEMQIELLPGKLDALWGVLYGRHWDKDNQVAPTDNDREYVSTVLRLQGYLSDGVHLLGETSLARERSTEGNVYRNHKDSVFTSTDGLSDPEGLEYGDDATRVTWQGKTGVILSPLGKGIYTRPSMRFLYGVQHSTMNNAFGNSFADSLDENEIFVPRESHWHHVVAVEVEAWF